MSTMGLLLFGTLATAVHPQYEVVLLRFMPHLNGGRRGVKVQGDKNGGRYMGLFVLSLGVEDMFVFACTRNVRISFLCMHRS